MLPIEPVSPLAGDHPALLAPLASPGAEPGAAPRAVSGAALAARDAETLPDETLADAVLADGDLAGEDRPAPFPCSALPPVRDGDPDGAPPPFQPSPLPPSPRQPTPRQQRLTGWTPENKRLFLEALARSGSVKCAAAYVAMSREGAYRLRRTDRAFGVAWEGALMQARELAEDELQDKAMNGFVEQLHYHGEVIDSRTRFDGRMLLALLGRLDKRAESETAALGAARFDDLLERIGADEEAGDLLDPPAARPAAPSAAPSATSAANMLAGGAASHDALLAAARAGTLDPAMAAAMYGSDVGTHAGTDAADEDEHIYWETADGWWTDYPPPADYHGVQEGRYGAKHYKRTMTEEEIAACGAEEEEADALALAEAQRRAAFGLDEDGGGAATCPLPPAGGVGVGLCEAVVPDEPSELAAHAPTPDPSREREGDSSAASGTDAPSCPFPPAGGVGVGLSQNPSPQHSPSEQCDPCDQQAGTAARAGHSTCVTTRADCRAITGDDGMTDFTGASASFTHTGFLRRGAAALAVLGAAGAVSGCATLAGTVGESYNTALVGQQEIPGPGDPDGTGTAKITADATTNQICYDLTVQNISRPTSAHIHKGARGDMGPPVVTLEPPVTGATAKCLRVDKQMAAAIIANPSGYYVDIHTADYPNGAIRGQL